MQIYLVGGAIRDRLLGLPVSEKDWVVVGATLQEMLALGFKPVGKEFPVFLHPLTHEEYALARTERKVGKGYKGFTFYTDPKVTLEEDLQRRDLTINAIAEDSDGNLIDPFNGQKDLQHKVLRHVSTAFQEDPVRILRTARFAAKLPTFTLDTNTLHFMQNMVQAGEVAALTAERVWQELQRALNNIAPQRFFNLLTDCGALPILFPEFEHADYQQLQHPLTPTARFALLCQTVTPHDIKNLAHRYRIPNDYSELALLVSQHLMTYQQISWHDPTAILALLLQCDALRRPERFANFLTIATLHNTPADITKKQHLQQALHAIKNIDTSELQQAGLSGKDFANALQTLRHQVIAKILK